MPSVMRSFRLPEELNRKVEEAAGGDFSGWARAAFEAYLSGSAASTGREPVRGADRSVPGPNLDRAEAFRRANSLLAAKKRA
jgi:hypothetical protein